MPRRDWWNRLAKPARPRPRRSQPRPALEPLEDRTVLSAGALDPTFGTGGKVVFDLPGSSRSTLTDIALQPDGKIIAVGGINDFSQAQDFAVVRFNPDGSRDTSFGSGGLVTTDFGANTRSDQARAVAVQSDGKIVVGGEAQSDTFSPRFALARYNPDGSLDATFGIGGKVITDPPGDNNLWDIALQADGKVVAAGSNGNFQLARYNPDGSLDASFGGTGVVTTGGLLGNGGFALSVAVQADGKIVAAGQTANGTNALARYNADGALDATFNGDGNGDGIILASFDLRRGEQIQGIVLQPDGKIVGTGVVNSPNGTSDLGVVRLNPDGSPDTSFDGDGKILSCCPPIARAY
jgi:uncharacterized delta-60 repeat protein